MNLDGMTLWRRVFDWQSCRKEIENALVVEESLSSTRLKKLDLAQARIQQLEAELNSTTKTKTHLVGFVRAAFQLDRPNPQETIRRLVEKK